MQSLKTKDIAYFVKNMIWPKFGPGYFIYKRQDLVRMRGPFLQGVLFAKKRSGWLHVIPTFYVAGANLADPVIFQTMSVPVHGIDEARRWKWHADTLLDDHLASHIVSQLEEYSPLSFVEALDDLAVGASLTHFAKELSHWAPFLSLAFFCICSGNPSARDNLDHARRIFLKLSRYGSGTPPLEFEQALLARFDELEARLDDPDCISICRTEAEEHAARLFLPPIEWPTEWPLIAPVWPKAKIRGWLSKLLP